MRKKRINDQTTAFIFDEIDNFSTIVYLINKPNRFYIVDTYCGADSMRQVLSYAEELDSGKRLTVINTHHHWDHIWGNCLFENRTIIGHNGCYQMIKDHYQEQYKKNRHYATGDCEMTLPNLTFQNNIKYQDDGIEIFYSPGHTADSISIYDKEHGLLIVGDNLEKPLIYVEDVDLERYLDTLEKYIDYMPKTIASGHTVSLSIEDIEETIDYLRRLKSGESITFEDSYKQKCHEANLKFLTDRI